MPNEQTSVPLFASGEVLTSANMNISAGTGVPVFATTVTRDAGFGGAGEKVLAEGQLCYLSDSNVVQYYTGAAWANLGATAPTTAFTSGQQTTTSTSYVGLTTATAVTVTTGTTAIVVIQANLTTGTANSSALGSFAISGATTQASSDSNAIILSTSSSVLFLPTMTLLYYQTGLTAGSNTFTMQYKLGSAGTLYASDRRITVFPL